MTEHERLQKIQAIYLDFEKKFADHQKRIMEIMKEAREKINALQIQAVKKSLQDK